MGNSVSQTPTFLLSDPCPEEANKLLPPMKTKSVVCLLWLCTVCKINNERKMANETHQWSNSDK
jgi:hypothetical protein